MLTALYDGNCLICQSTRKTIAALDWLNRVACVDLHDARAWQSRFPQLNCENLLGEIHVIDQNGKLYAGLSATRRISKELPLGWPLWLLLSLPGFSAFAEAAYRFIARHRYRVNRLFNAQSPACDHQTCAQCKTSRRSHSVIAENQK